MNELQKRVLKRLDERMLGIIRIDPDLDHPQYKQAFYFVESAWNNYVQAIV